MRYYDLYFISRNWFDHIEKEIIDQRVLISRKNGVKDMIDNQIRCTFISYNWFDHIDEYIIASWWTNKFDFVISFRHINCSDTLLNINLEQQMWINNKLKGFIYFDLINFVIYIIKHCDHQPNESHTIRKIKIIILLIN